MNAMQAYLDETNMTQEQAALHLTKLSDYPISQTQVSQFARDERKPRFQFLVRIWLHAKRETPEYRFAIAMMDEIDPGLGAELDART